MAIIGKDKRGSGSKENVGRKVLQYESKKICKNVPKDVYKSCMALIDSEVEKWKELNKC